jgi:hypothetical protein
MNQTTMQKDLSNNIKKNEQQHMETQINARIFKQQCKKTQIGMQEESNK